MLNKDNTITTIVEATEGRLINLNSFELEYLEIEITSKVLETELRSRIIVHEDRNSEVSNLLPKRYNKEPLYEVRLDGRNIKPILVAFSQNPQLEKIYDKQENFNNEIDEIIKRMKNKASRCKIHPLCETSKNVREKRDDAHKAKCEDKQQKRDNSDRISNKIK